MDVVGRIGLRLGDGDDDQAAQGWTKETALQGSLGLAALPKHVFVKTSQRGAPRREVDKMASIINYKRPRAKRPYLH